MPRALAVAMVGFFALTMLVYYPLGALIVHNIDDRPDFTPGRFSAPNGSQAVSMAVALIDREVNQHYWTPNDPFFYPTALMVRMPAYQRGVISGIARFTIELADQIGRTRGSSLVDPEVQKAIGHLNYQPDVWVYDTSISLLPTTSSETQYRNGMEALMRYNEKLSRGEAVLDKRADNLLGTLDRIAYDLGSSSAAIAEHIEESSTFSFNSSARLYYFTKGKLAAYYYLIKAMEQDFAPIIEERQLTSAWAQMLHSLREGMEHGHFLVLNASPDSALLANHLAMQGFYLVRARTQIREVTNILLK